MSIHVTLADQHQVRIFKSCLQALGRLGTSQELMLEGLPDALILRAINSSRSGYMAITFTKTFFDHYTLHELPVVQAGLLTKHLLAVFRTQRIVQLDMHINPEHASTSVTIKCENDMVKTYTIVLQECEILQAAIDRNSLPISVTAQSIALNRLLQSFTNTLQEVTLASLPDSGGRSYHAGKAVQLHSFTDNTKRGKNTLHTQLAVDTLGVFDTHTHHSTEAADVTFNLKDFRTMVSLCENVNANVTIRFDKPGAPLLVEPIIQVEAGLHAELVLATLLESQLDKLQQQALNQAPVQRVQPPPPHLVTPDAIRCQDTPMNQHATTAAAAGPIGGAPGTALHPQNTPLDPNRGMSSYKLPPPHTAVSKGPHEGMAGGRGLGGSQAQEDDDELPPSPERAQESQGLAGARLEGMMMVEEEDEDTGFG